MRCAADYNDRAEVTRLADRRKQKMKRILIVVVTATLAAGAFAYSNLVAQSGSARGAAPSNELPTYGHDPGVSRLSRKSHLPTLIACRSHGCITCARRLRPIRHRHLAPGKGAGAAAAGRGSRQVRRRPLSSMD